MKGLILIAMVCAVFLAVPAKAQQGEKLTDRMIQSFVVLDVAKVTVKPASKAPQHTSKSLTERAMSGEINLLLSPVAEASGVVVSEHVVATNYHVGIPWASILYGNIGLGRIIQADPRHDLILVEFPEYTFSPDLKLGGPVKIGEILKNWSNGDGELGVYDEFMVAKIRTDEEDVLLTKIVVEGSSGSGIYNMQGELVGLVSGNPSHDGEKVGYGKMVPVEFLKPLLDRAGIKYK